MWPSSGVAIAPVEAGLQGLQVKREKAAPWASQLQGKWAFCACPQYMQSLQLSSRMAHHVLGVAAGVQDLGK